MKKKSQPHVPPRIVRPIEPDEWKRAQNVLQKRGILQGGSLFPGFIPGDSMPRASAYFYDYMSAPIYDPLDIGNFGPNLSYDFVGLAKLATNMSLTNPTLWNLKIKDIWRATFGVEHWSRPDLKKRHRLLLPLWVSIKAENDQLKLYLENDYHVMVASWSRYMDGLLTGIASYILHET